MALVGYSDSEASSAEDGETKKPSAKPAKPTVSKVVHKANPQKITVNLPQALQAGNDDGTIPSESERPTKKARLGPRSFNAMLPAPKRSGAIAPTPKTNNRRGLGVGVNLKTSAAPGFSRDSPEIEEADAEEAQADPGASKAIVPEEEDAQRENVHPAEALSVNGTRIQGNPMKFRPLSVARKPQKKKRREDTTVERISRTAEEIAANSAQKRPEPPKVSLFSFDEGRDLKTLSAIEAKRHRERHAVDEVDGIRREDDDRHGSAGTKTIAQSISDATSNEPQTLDSIADDLNLSESARRQLFGRRGNSTSTPNIVNFDLDKEYADNNVLRQKGQQEQVRAPIRSVGSGKHSLRQLVDLATGQKEALEEAWTRARRDKKESGAKFGW